MDTTLYNLNDDSISVLPRILDPKMKFTVDSIKNMPNKNTTTKVEPQVPNKTKEAPPSGVYVFFQNYKYVILIIIIIILLVVIIYLVIKYYNKQKNKVIPINEKPNDTKVSQETKQKINEYVSNYIIDEEELNLPSETNDLPDNSNTIENATEENAKNTNDSSDDVKEILQQPQNIDFAIDNSINLADNININSQTRFEEINEEEDNNNLPVIDINVLEDNFEINSTNSEVNSEDRTTGLNELLNDFHVDNNSDTDDNSGNNKQLENSDIDYFKNYIKK